MNKLNKIVIATPIYPPEIGGPALYTKMLSEAFNTMGFSVSVVTYGVLKRLPTGIRHIFYAIKILPYILQADQVISLDTFSVGLPTVFLCRLLQKKVVVRVGGDFLWEEYVERTGEMILLSDFYRNNGELSTKEQWIFELTKFVLKNSLVVFSTTWQRNIFIPVYGLDISKTSIIENIFVKGKQRNIVPKDKIILSPTRNRVLKNKINLEKALTIVKSRFMDVVLDTGLSSQDEMKEKMLSSYCVAIVSLSEVSPNTVLDALSLGVPVVATEDCGMKDRLQNLVVWVNPKKPESIAEGISKLMNSTVYQEYMAEISKFTYIHTPENIANEFLNLFKNI